MPITITEGLAEIKTIGKRLQKKRDFIGQYLFRQEFQKDPLGNEGGSKTVLQREAQAISDLEAQIVAIRLAIASANGATAVTVGPVTKTIAEWLVWRREIAAGRKDHIQRLRSAAQSARTQAAQKALAVRTEDSGNVSDDLVINVDEAALAKEAEDLETILGTLDGLLSLKNATTMIEV